MYFRKVFSMRSEIDDGLSSCSNFTERQTDTEIASIKPVLPEIELNKRETSDKVLESFRDVLNRIAVNFFETQGRQMLLHFVEHEREIEKAWLAHREGIGRMTPHKSEACRKENDMLVEYCMIETSKSHWPCGLLLAKARNSSRQWIWAPCSCRSPQEAGARKIIVCELGLFQ